MSKKRKPTEAQLQKRAAKHHVKIQRQMTFLEGWGIDNLVKWINERNADWKGAPICFHHARQFLLNEVKKSFPESDRSESVSLAARAKLEQLGLLPDRIDVCVKPLEQIESEEKMRADAAREKAKRIAAKRDLVSDVKLPFPCDSSSLICYVPASDVFVAASSAALEIWENCSHIPRDGEWSGFDELVKNLHLAVQEVARRFPGLPVRDIAELLGFGDESFDGQSVFSTESFLPPTSFYDVVTSLIAFLCQRSFTDRKVIFSDVLSCAVHVEKFELSLVPLVGKNYLLPEDYETYSYQPQIVPRDKCMVALSSVYPSVMLEAACNAAICAVKEYRTHTSFRTWCNASIVDELVENLQKCLTIAKNSKQYGASASFRDLVSEIRGTLDVYDDWCDVNNEGTLDSVVPEVLQLATPKLGSNNKFCSDDALLYLGVHVCDYAKRFICEQNAYLLQWIENHSFWR